MLLFHTRRRQPRATLFPYTTLFRSEAVPHGAQEDDGEVLPLEERRDEVHHRRAENNRGLAPHPLTVCAPIHGAYLAAAVRSEEHTSELQSLRHLVCRLLLEKKKNSM